MNRWGASNSHSAKGPEGLCQDGQVFMGGILYLHGFCSSAQSRKGQLMAELFARVGVEVTLPDIDEGDFRNSTMTKQLALVEGLLRELRPRMLIGSSLGGYQAALQASRNPDSVPALVLLAPAFDFANRLKKFLGAETDRWRREGSLLLYHYRYQREVPLGYEFIRDAMAYDAIPRVTVPTTVLHGLRDEVVSPELSKKFAKGRPNVQIEWLETDHGMLDVTQEIWEIARQRYLQAGASRH